MANSSNALARIQGQGLVETTTKDVSMSGAALAATPAGAEMQGRGPDSAKMAGTQPAKVNALRMAIQDTGSRRLAALRETAQPDLAQDARTADIYRKSTVVGKLDEVYGTYITEAVNAAFTAGILSRQGAQLKSAAFTTDAEQTALMAAITMVNRYNAGKGTKIGPDGKETTDKITGADIDAAVKTINEALKRTGATPVNLTDDKTTSAIQAKNLVVNLFENLTKEQMADAFAADVASVKEKMPISEFLQSTDADTFAEAQGFEDIENGETAAQQLEALIKSILPPDADLTKMKLEDLRDGIQKWREEEFKDVAKYQEILQSEGASRAQRQFAAENLRRLGKLGTIALDEKVRNIDAQMQDGDVLRIGDDTSYEEFDIQEFFTKPEQLSKLIGWLGNPEDAPALIKGWITANEDAIKNKIAELEPDLQAAANKIQENNKTIEIAGPWKPSQDMLNYFFGESLFENTVAEKTFASPEQKAKYALLQDASQPPSGSGTVMLQLMNSLSLNNAALSGTGLDGKKVFNDLTTAEIKQIIQYGVPQFMDNLVANAHAKNFNTTIGNLSGNELKAAINLVFDRQLGQADAGKAIAALVGRTDLKDFKDNLIPKDSVLQQYIKADGTFDFQKIKDLVTAFAGSNRTQLADGTTFGTLKTALNKLTDAIREVPAPVEESVDYNKWFNLGKDPANFKWDSLDINTRRERSAFISTVGYHPEYNIKTEEAREKDYATKLQQEIDRLRAQGWEIWTQKDGDIATTWLTKDNRPVNYDPFNQFGLKEFGNLKQKIESSRARTQYYRDNYAANEKKYTDNLNKFVENKRSQNNTAYDTSKERYDKFLALFGG